MTDRRHFKNRNIVISHDHENGSFRRIIRLPSWLFKLKIVNRLCAKETRSANLVEIGHTVAEIPGFSSVIVFRSEM